MQHLGVLIILFPLCILLQYLLTQKFLLPSVLDLPIVYNELKTRGVSNMPVATLDLLLHVQGRTDVVNLWVGALSAALHEVYDGLEVCGILEDSEVILELRLRPDGYIAHVGLGKEVEEFGDCSWEDIGDLGGSVAYLGKDELFYPVKEYDERLEHGIAQAPQIFSVIHEGNDPRVGLRDNEVVDIEEDGKLIHRQILSNRSILELAVHEGIFLGESLVVLAVEVSCAVDEGNRATGSRCAPDQHIRSCEVIEQSIRIVLRCSSDCDVQDDTEFIIGLLEGIISYVVSQKFLQNFDVQSASLSACPSELFEQVQSFLVGKGSEVECLLIEKFFPCMCGDDRSYDAACAASSNNPRQAISFNESLDYSDMIHSHDCTSAEQKRTPSNRMPHLPKKLQFLSLRDISSHYRLKSLGQFFLVLLNQPFGAGVGMPIEKRAIGVGNIPVAMRSDDLYQLEGISLLSCLIHQPNQLLQILIIIIRGVYLIDPGFHTGYLIILLRQCPPSGVCLSLLHECLDLLHLAGGLDRVLDFFFVVICDFLDDGELVVDLLADGFPEVAEGFQKHCGGVKIILINIQGNGRGRNGGAWGRMLIRIICEK